MDLHAGALYEAYMSHYSSRYRSGTPKPMLRLDFSNAYAVLDKVHISYLIFAAGTNTILAYLLTIAQAPAANLSVLADFTILLFGITLTELVWYGAFKGLKDGSFYGWQHRFAQLVLMICFTDASGGIFAKFHAEFRPVYVEYVMPFSIPIMAFLAIVLLLSKHETRLQRREIESATKEKFEARMETINARRDRTRAKRNDRLIRSIARWIGQGRLWIFTALGSLLLPETNSTAFRQALAIASQEQSKLKKLAKPSSDGHTSKPEDLELVANGVKPSKKS